MISSTMHALSYPPGKAQLRNTLMNIVMGKYRLKTVWARWSVHGQSEWRDWVLLTMFNLEFGWFTYSPNSNSILHRLGILPPPSWLCSSAQSVKYSGNHHAVQEMYLTAILKGFYIGASFRIAELEERQCHDKNARGLDETKYNCNHSRPSAFDIDMAIFEAIIIKLGMLITNGRIAELEVKTRPQFPSLCGLHLVR